MLTSGFRKVYLFGSPERKLLNLWGSRDAKNRALGRTGEDRIFHNERLVLN